MPASETKAKAANSERKNISVESLSTVRASSGAMNAYLTARAGLWMYRFLPDVRRDQSKRSRGPLAQRGRAAAGGYVARSLVVTLRRALLAAMLCAAKIGRASCRER